MAREGVSAVPPAAVQGGPDRGQGRNEDGQWREPVEAADQDMLRFEPCLGVVGAAGREAEQECILHQGGVHQHGEHRKAGQDEA